jgi:hypothetical protein
MKFNTNLFHSLTLFTALQRLHSHETPAETRWQFCIGAVLRFFRSAGTADVSPRDMEKLLKRAYKFSRFGLDLFFVRSALYLRALRVSAADERRRSIYSVERAFNSSAAAA